MTDLYKTKYLDFKSAKSPSGHEWYYVKRANDKTNSDSAVAITVLVEKSNGYNFLLLKTKRPPIYSENKAKYCVECPAGLVADENINETLIECIKKELKEETGYIADNIFIELNNSSTSAGLSSETLTFATAIIKNDKPISKPVDDGGIIVKRFFVSADNIYSYLKSVNTKEISISSAAICGIFYALMRINKLK